MALGMVIYITVGTEHENTAHTASWELEIETESKDLFVMELQEQTDCERDAKPTWHWA